MPSGDSRRCGIHGVGEHALELAAHERTGVRTPGKKVRQAPAVHPRLCSLIALELLRVPARQLAARRSRRLLGGRAVPQVRGGDRRPRARRFPWLCRCLRRSASRCARGLTDDQQPGARRLAPCMAVRIGAPRSGEMEIAWRARFAAGGNVLRNTSSRTRTLRRGRQPPGVVEQPDADVERRRPIGKIHP